LALIKPDGIAKMGQIIDTINTKGFLITKLKKCQLSRNEVFEFYAEHQSKPFFKYAFLSLS